ncbi:MAG: SIR2 family protein [Prevotella sp.]|nr:SIR2 family protein [Prevotella sp.]
MGNGITIIVGAGAVLDFDHKGIFPSVKNITDEVLKLSIQKVAGGERPLLRELYDHIVRKLNLVGRLEVNRYIPPQLNFESLLHVIEMCISYSSCWNKEYISWLALPEFGTLIQPDDFLKDIQTYDYIRGAYELQKTVMSIVNQYDTSFCEDKLAEQWYRDFWKSLSGKSNIFNLNYDNTIENSLGEYEDGFPPIKEGEEYSRFSAKRYYNNQRGVSTIAHLHGQILFSEAREYPLDYSIRDLVKNKDYQTACKNRIGGQFPPSNQAKEEYLQPVIVSGSRKTEKMTFAPNNVYLSDIARKVVENNRLMVIGYSFGDLYLNEILGLGMDAHGDDFRVVIIDKFPSYVNSYNSLFHHIAHRCNPQEYTFVSRLAKDGLFVEVGQKEYPIIFEDYYTPVVSRNGKLMMYIGGFKDAVVNHKETILGVLGV